MESSSAHRLPPIYPMPLLLRSLLLACLFVTVGFSFAAATAQEEPAKQVAAEQPAEHAAADQKDHAAMAAGLPLWTVLPFAALLLCIAVLPLVHGHWWEHNHNKAIVVAILTIPLVLYLLVAYGSPAWHGLIEKVLEYLSFIILLAALYIISGGI